MTLDAIIIHYHDLRNTRELIESIKRNDIRGGLKIRIIVVDNGTQDNKTTFENILYIQNPKNLGFTGGVNVAVKRALGDKSDYVLILNNDIFLKSDFFTNIIKTADNADIISPKIYFAPGFEFHKDRYKESELGKVIWFAGGKIDWSNIIGTHIGVDEVDSGQFDKQKEIEFATGACVLIKTEVFQKIGLLDEKYFLYLEDMDFSLRAKRAGMKLSYSPKAIAWHKNAASSSSGSDLQNYYFTRNRLLFAFKFAKTKTKFAVLKQLTLESLKDTTKRKALIDFITLRFGQGSFRIHP